MILPVPPSPNKWKSNPFAQQAQKDEYRELVWAKALRQGRPVRDPPERVRVHATLYLCKLRDEDNATGSLKWTLDALRQKQQGHMKWRQGIADKCGFFVDDDSERLTLTVEQVRVKHRPEERLELTITEVP
jgi:hypothetical protein